MNTKKANAGQAQRMVAKPPTIMNAPKIAGINESRSTGAKSVLSRKKLRGKTNHQQQHAQPAPWAGTDVNGFQRSHSRANAKSGTIQPCEYNPSLQACW